MKFIDDEEQLRKLATYTKWTSGAALAFFLLVLTEAIGATVTVEGQQVGVGDSRARQSPLRFAVGFSATGAILSAFALAVLSSPAQDVPKRILTRSSFFFASVIGTQRICAFFALVATSFHLGIGWEVVGVSTFLTVVYLSVLGQGVEELKTADLGPEEPNELSSNGQSD